jgi:hypothetical protein
MINNRVRKKGSKLHICCKALSEKKYSVLARLWVTQVMLSDIQVSRASSSIHASLGISVRSTVWVSAPPTLPKYFIRFESMWYHMLY